MDMYDKIVLLAIINRQWKHRNHDVFGPLAKRQIRFAIRKLRGN